MASFTVWLFGRCLWLFGRCLTKSRTQELAVWLDSRSIFNL